MLRKVMPVALVAALFLSTLTVSAAPADAAGSFELTYFPHQGLDSEFSNDWGNPRDGGARTHKGTDIFAPKHSEVVAVADGFITFVGSSKRPGNQIRIRHGNGWESWYFHLNNDTPGTDNNRASRDLTFAPGIEKGVFVTAGTVIGYVGDSGNAEPTASHTHFELHHRGRTLNPYPYLRDAWNLQIRATKMFASFDPS